MSVTAELSDDEVFGPATPAAPTAELSDDEVFGAPAAPAAPPAPAPVLGGPLATEPAAPPPPSPTAAWDDKSWLERGGHQLRSGVETGRQILNMSRASGAATSLANVRQNEANWDAEAQRDPEMAAALRGRFRGPSQAQQDRLGGVVRDSVGNVIASQQRQAQIPSSPHAAAMAEQANRGDYAGAWETFKQHPGDIMSQAIVPSLPTMAAAMVPPLTAAGLGLGTVPFLLATYGGSAATRLGSNAVGTIAQAAKADGVDLADADAVARWMVTRPEQLQGALQKAGHGALAGALVDTIAMGLSRPVVASAGIVRNAQALGQNALVGTAQPPAAAVASQLAQEGQVTNPGEVAMAAAGGLGQAGMNTGLQTVNAWGGGGPRIGLRPPGEPPAGLPGPSARPPSEPPGAPGGTAPSAAPSGQPPVGARFTVTEPTGPQIYTVINHTDAGGTVVQAQVGGMPMRPEIWHVAGTNVSFIKDGYRYNALVEQTAREGEPIRVLVRGVPTTTRLDLAASQMLPPMDAFEPQQITNLQGAPANFEHLDLGNLNPGRPGSVPPAAPATPPPSPGTAGAGAGGAVAPLKPGQLVQTMDPATGMPSYGTVRTISDDGSAIVIQDGAGGFHAVSAADLSPVAPATQVVPTPAEAFTSGMAEIANDPRTGTEIAQQHAAEQQQAIQAVQDRLPPTATIEKVPGGWALMEGDNPIWTVPGEWPTAADLAAFEELAQQIPPVAPGTPNAPVIVTQPEHLDAEAATVNENPTPGQKESGNYQKGHILIGPNGAQLPVTIENGVGSVRSGTSPDGTQWSNVQPGHYGYIKRARGADGDNLDVYLGPGAHDPQSHPVFVVDQRDLGDGGFDEHKVMIGYPTEGAARIAYEAAFGDGKGEARIGAITPMAWDEFRQWVRTADTRKPLAYVPAPPPLKLTVPRRLRTFKEGPLTLLEFLTLGGGIRDNRGDLRAIGAHQHFVPRAGALVRPNGRSLDYAREAAAEQGYLSPQADITDFLNLIDQELRGFPVYAGPDQAEINQQRIDEAAQRERDAIDRFLPEVKAVAQQRRYVLTPEEMDNAAWLMLQRGVDAESALADTIVQSMRDAEAAADADAPPGYNPDDDVLQYWADTLGAKLTNAQQWEARDLWEAGWHPAQAVTYAAGIGPMIEAESAMASAAVPGTGWDIPFGGESNGGGSGEFPGGSLGGTGGTDNAPPGAGEQPAGPTAEPAGGSAPGGGEREPAGGSPSGGGAGDAAVPSGEAAGSEAVPSPAGAEPESEPAPAAWGGGDQYLIPGTRPSVQGGGSGAENGADAGGAGSRPTATQEKPGGVGSLFDPNAGAQTDIVDAVKGSRDVGNLAAPDLVGLGNAFAEEFEKGKAFKTIVQARKLASEWLGGPVQPGTRQAKIVDEAVELGAVIAASRIAQAPQTTEATPVGERFDRILHLYQDQQPTLGVRTGSSIERQAYSTPLPLAYALSQMIDTRGHRVYEPTAGNGALLIDADVNNALVNELDPERRAALEAQGFEPTGHDATTWTPGKPYAWVIGNPPFGQVKEGETAKLFDLRDVIPGYQTTQIDHAIVVRALGGALDDVSAGFIVGGHNKLAVTEEARRAAYRGKGMRTFYANLYANWNVVDHFVVSGDLYAKQGAAWPVDVFVIDGKGKSSLPLPAARPPRILNSWDQIRELAVNGAITGTSDDGLAPGEGEPGGVEPRPGSGGGPGGAAAPRPRPGEADGSGGVSVGNDSAGSVDAGEGVGPGGGGAGTGTSPSAGGSVAGGAGVSEPVSGGPGAGGGQPAVSEPVEQPVPAAGEQQEPKPTAVRPGGAGNEPIGVDGSGDTGADASRIGTVETRGGDHFDVFSDGSTHQVREEGRLTSSYDPSNDTIYVPDVDTYQRLAENSHRQDHEFVMPAKYSRTPIVGHYMVQLSNTKRGIRPNFAGQVIKTDIPPPPEPEKPKRTRKPKVKLPTEEEGLAAPPPDTDEATPVAPVKAALEKDKPTASQVVYAPKSNNEPVGTLAPLNLATAMHDALDRIVADYKPGPNGAPPPTIDEWVADKLDYTQQQLQDYFSAEQVDALALGIHQIDRKSGFIIGDQTGVGKGRFVAGMMRYAILQGKIPIFVTERANLFKDIVRDLIDIGMSDAMDQIVATNNAIRVPLTDEPGAPVLRTPTAKVHEVALAEMAAARKLPAGKKMLFTTYSQMSQVKGNDTTRQSLLSSLASDAFVILDEAHNAGGQGAGQRPVMNRKTGVMKVPRAQFFRNIVDNAHAVAYSSATWAKHPRVMDLYGRKTDMRLAVQDLGNLADAISTGGVPMQQIVSAQLAQVGQFTRRERSFDGIPYDLTVAPVDRKTYDDTATNMAGIFNLYEDYVRPVIDGLRDELDGEGAAVGADSGVGDTAISSVGFGATMHNIVNQMLLASKAKATADLAIEAIKNGEKPVITVANTMEKFMDDYVQDGGFKFGDKMPLTFNDVLLRYLKRQLRYTVRGPDDEKPTEHWLTPQDLGREGERIYYALEQAIKDTDLSEFPASPIDFIRNRIQDAGYRIEEITGRQTRVKYEADGTVVYEARPSSERTIAGKNEVITGFNSGPVDALIINQSAASGLSLHAYYKFKDQKPRMMIVAQPEANIDTHMQLLGRIHRTGQVVLPRYVQLVADVPAEKRPAAVLAKKMASLSASTTANRKGLLGTSSAVDFMNRYGGSVVAGVIAEDPSLISRLALRFGVGGTSSDEEEGGESAADKVMEALDGMDPEAVARKFTGRVPLLSLAEQEEIYDKIESRYIALIEELDANGENALEAKTVDLQAVTLDSTEFIPGQPGDNPFSSAAVLERVDVRRTSRPPPAHAILRAVAVGINEGASLPPQDVLAEEPLERIANMIVAGRQGAAQEQLENHVSQVAAATLRSIEALDKRFKDATAKQTAAAQINANSQRITQVLKLAVPGSIVRIRAGDDLISQYAMVLSVKGDGTNLAAPSAWEWTLIQPDGIQRRLPGSLLFPDAWEQARYPDDFRRIAEEPAGNVHDFLAEMKEAAAHGREERFMVTGNLLAGYSQARGQILNYTDSEGRIRQGILLARTFNATRFLQSTAQQFDTVQGAAFLTDRTLAIPPFLESSDGHVRVMASDQPDVFFMEVPQSRQDGSRYYLDNFIRRNIYGGDFVSAGNKMRARFDRRAVRQILGGIATLLRRSEGRLISTHPEAKAWVQRATGAAEGIASSLRALGRDQSGGFDMNALLDLVPEGARTKIKETAEIYGGVIERFIDRVHGRPSTSNITIERPPSLRIIDPLSAQVKTPSRLFAKTAWDRMVHEGILGEEKQSKFIHRLTDEYNTIKKRLNTAGGSWDTVTEALFAGDAAEIDARPGSNQLNDHFEEFGLAPSERRAYLDLHRLLQKIARMHDMHNRAMLPAARRQQHAVWQQMERLLSHASVTGPGARALYAERRRLAYRIKKGTGDLIAAGERLTEIEKELREIRMNDPALQEELGELQDTYDQLEARLQKTGVRNRRAGYIPHKFFGNYRLFRFDAEGGEDGTGSWIELTSDQGFYPTFREALNAAERIYAQDDTAVLQIREKQITWPETLNGTELSDRAYRRLQDKMAETMPDATDDEIREMLKGVARRRYRRRTYAPGMLRKGHDGYSEDMDRVLLTHIGQTVRYVVMDELKYKYVTRHEAAGFHRADALLTPEQRAEKRAIEAWWADVNGNKQPWEAVIDTFLLSPAGPTKALLATGASSVAIGWAIGLGPMWTAALTGWLGHRLYKSLKEGGQFPLRTFQNKLLSDMAHLKLGMLLNLHSAAVNLTQTALTTAPELGFAYTGLGIQRAIKALLDQSHGRNTPDAVLLERANIRTAFHMSDSNKTLATEDSKAARISMLVFQNVEVFNRAVAFFGGYRRATDGGMAPGPAFRSAEAVVRKTQFHYGNADKAELLRKQILRSPTQFKNFQFHMIAYVFGLDRKQAARFYPMMFMLGGLLGMPGLQILDFASKNLAGFSPTDAIRDATFKAATYGNLANNAVLMTAYGIPGYLTSLTSSVGMGVSFLPSQMSDLAGPMLGTFRTLAQSQAKGATLVDQLAILAPAAKTLKAIEMAANGNSITSPSFWTVNAWTSGNAMTSWRQKGAVVFQPNMRQILMYGAGFTPIEATIQADYHYRIIQRAEQRRGTADTVLAEVARLVRGNRMQEIGPLIENANKPKEEGGLGLEISREMVRNAIKGQMTNQPQRDMQMIPRRQRGEQAPILRGIQERLQ